MKLVLCLLLTFLVLANAADKKIHKDFRKQLAGPPSEFGLHNIPSPIFQVQKEDSAFFQTSLALDSERGVGHLSSKLSLLVDSNVTFVIALMSKHQDKLSVSLAQPDGTPVDVEKYATKDYFPVGEERIPAVVYQINDPERGYWVLTLKTKEALSASHASSIANEDQPNVGVLLWNNNNVEIYTHLSTYFTHTDSTIGLVATTTPETEADVNYLGGSIGRQILSAVMDVTLPDGNTVAVPMMDDGMGMDLYAGDGVYVGTFSDAKEVGAYRAKAVLTGVHSSGTEFVRTTQHMINVAERSLGLTGKAEALICSKDKNRLKIHLEVSLTQSGISKGLRKNFRAYSEVWGVDSQGKEVAIAWVGGIVDIESFKKGYAIPLSLDLNWVANAKAQAPFTLRNVYVSDPVTQIPESELAEIKVELTKKFHVHYQKLALNPLEITKEMREGKPPAQLISKRASGKKGLILLHGYCSSDNPWQSTSDLWTNPYYFLNPNASITNEEFAQKVIKFAESQGLDSYALIGHSQGGMVSAHILNYYFTGMDNLDASKRLIQSVGTPYMGSNAAGTAANIGKSFGVACGSNFDLSTDGAVLWLSGITQATREQIYYYTTTYGSGGFFGDYCSLPMNAILEWPNDGTTELDNAILQGGHNMGNTKEWCHVTEMKYPAQFTDRKRNKEMNANAASN
eukprot:TRINITY_DN742_c0_g1_i1.p1 TRINITY_DN742_c0_g1~~TRINITY_DN742_c0_g1_i1.p1  ORF type:complete len:682 (-),score=243.01 TRINITY_DN742_c0_g1_i1:71-2116(-)